MFKRVLIPVDIAHTEKAAEMVEAAKRVANDETQFVIASIIHSVPALAELSVPQEYFDMAEEEARKTLTVIAKENGLDAKIELRVGQPANDILTMQKELDIDLVIIGSHKPGLQDYFLGSTASRVVRHAQCPVLVMR
ncbi:MAG: universal stress protein [Rhizobiaceae bacterium]|nr:universal stress protein [Rhizobiaceae bacterium]